MDEIEVDRIADFAVIQIGAVGAIEIRAHLQVRSGWKLRRQPPSRFCPEKSPFASTFVSAGGEYVLMPSLVPA